jgi:hypothetical protein
MFYGIGTIIALVAYGLFGGGYAHAPGLHHLIILLMLVVGTIWLISNLFHIIRRSERFHQGNMIVHLIIAVAFISYLKYEEYKNADRKVDERTFDRNVLTITSYGDTLEARHVGNPVYLKIKDSVYYNFIDSTKLDGIEIMEVKRY